MGERIIQLYDNLFTRIKRLKPHKDDTIFIKVEDNIIKISRKQKQIIMKPAQLSERKGEMMVKFSDLSTLQYVLEAKDVMEYGDRLLYAVLDKKVLLDPGNVDKATRSGFFKLISRSRIKNHVQVFELTIPVM